MAVNCQKFACCSMNLTIATRMIAFIGVAVSVLLITALLKDKSENDFHVSRIIALALGLDWRHIHPHTNTAPNNDPEGKIISAILIFYSASFFLINFLLAFAAISYDRRFAVPWLLCEMLGCVSKAGALIFHLATEFDQLSNIFVTGSLLYIVVMTWWWFVVFVAQSSWKINRPSTPSQPSHKKTTSFDGEVASFFDSAESYPFSAYATI